MTDRWTIRIVLVRRQAGLAPAPDTAFLTNNSTSAFMQDATNLNGEPSTVFGGTLIGTARIYEDQVFQA
jgi:hypothetical protein